jgi:hypothetical protein
MARSARVAGRSRPAGVRSLLMAGVFLSRVVEAG